MQSIKLSRWFSALALLGLQYQDTTNQQQTNAMGLLPDLAISAGKIVKSGEGKTVRATATVDARCMARSVLPGLSLNNNSWAPAATEVPTRCSLR